MNKEKKIEIFAFKEIFQRITMTEKNDLRLDL